MEIIFDKWGYQCYSASSPRQAMRALVDRDFDVIVTDILMPFMDGREFILAAKKCGSRAKIIVVTAYFGMAMKSEIGTEAFPVDAYFTKPFNISDIREAIEKFMKQSTPLAANKRLEPTS